MFQERAIKNERAGFLRHICKLLWSEHLMPAVQNLIERFRTGNIQQNILRKITRRRCEAGQHLVNELLLSE